MKNGSASDDLTPTISAEDKDSILLGILEGSYSVQEACRRHGLAEKEIERWVVAKMETGCAPLLVVWSLCSSLTRSTNAAAQVSLGAENAPLANQA